ncbi:A/G-specific adenine glycosylase [Dehalococcoidia bacterium]|nr:A/G-specific adenine glycosylase [Dehalococcoidia bacterium]
MKMVTLKQKKQFFVDGVLKWGKNNYRSFPWRQVKDPFLTLLAEMLLSKTPAWRVEPVYDRIAKTYGSAELLANASQSALAAEIEPLGLHNKRAGQLIEIAKSLSKIYNGKVPRKARQLAEFPGVGPYIAHAVPCFAYEDPAAVVDSNVARVLTRFFGLDCVGRPALSKTVWEFATTLVAETVSARQYNYALLDFAAQVCASKPKCRTCPVRNVCQFLAAEDGPKQFDRAVQQSNTVETTARR